VLYEFDEDTERFNAVAGNMPFKTKISFKEGEGPVGFCADSKKVLNINDIRRDERFAKNRTFMGIAVRACLCVPYVAASTGRVMNILQIVDRVKGSGGEGTYYFTRENEMVAQSLAWVMGGMRERTFLLKSVDSHEAKTTGFFTSVKKLFGSSELHTAALNIITKTRTLFDAAYALLFRIDRQEHELILVAQSSEQVLFIPQGYAKAKDYKGMTSERVPLHTKSLATTCAKTVRTINVKDARNDNRFNIQADEYLAEGKYQLGSWGTGAVLVTPVMDTKNRNEIRGVHVLGRTKKKPFSRSDEAELQGFLDMMAICINRVTATEGDSRGVGKNVSHMKQLIDEYPEANRLPEMKHMMETVVKMSQVNDKTMRLLDPAIS